MEQFADIRVDRVNIQMEDTLVRNLRLWRVQELGSRNGTQKFITFYKFSVTAEDADRTEI